MQSKDDVNISEVCQQTGVAAVTLRAWERRYGIIKPKRTPKGHRLYTPANIEEIKQIVNWLNRGVAISKVAELLIAGETPSQVGSKDESWQQLQQEVLSTLIALKQRSLNGLFEKLSKSMPFTNLCENIYQPLLHQLMARWQSKPLGYQLEQQLWQQCWQRQITVLTWRADKQKSRANCCLVNLDRQDSALDYWLFYALLLQSGIQVDAINQVDDLSALPRLRNSLDHPLIIFGDNKIVTREIEQVVKTKVLSHKDTIVIGRVADIHQDVFTNMAIDHVGGDAITCWQSACYQSWIERVISK
jgi:DNA-binding transcriptional MerR regulator